MSSGAVIDLPRPPAAELEPLRAPAPASQPTGDAERDHVRLDLPRYDLAAALALERALGVSHVLAQVLVRRGYADPEAARELLAASVQHELTEFEGLEHAAALVERHIEAGSAITVHGDYDVDGVCATAVLVRALRARGADVSWYLPSRLEDGYGLAAATVARLARRGTRLLITVDCGITAVDEVNAARAAGLEVLVCDHHQPRADGVLPDCPIVHPALAGYPCPELCGTGVAHMLARALDAPTAADDLELVALATVADLVPLRGENRRLVRAGLAQLAGTAKPGLRALIEVSRTDPSALDARALGFRLAPRINAAGRLARADAGLELILTDDPARAREIAQELDRINTERRAIEERTTWEALALVRAMGERRAYVLAGEGWHQGVIGIVASRVVEATHRPTVMIATDGAALAHGSGRSIPGFDLLAGLTAASSELERYGGHRAAAGLTIAPRRIDAFREAFESHAAAVLTPELLQRVQTVDAIASCAQLGLGLAEELELLEPCGIGNPGVTLMVPGARLHDVRPVGDGRHARFVVSSAGASASAVSFGCDGRVPGASGRDPEPRDAAFRLERNVWRGTVEPRLVLRHARACAPAPIEVLGEPLEFLSAALDELDRPLDGEPATSRGPAVQAVRTVLDRRAEGPLAALADARATGEPVLAVCADVPRRLAGLRGLTGGFALTGHESLSRTPALAERFMHVVVIDPPSGRAADEAIRVGRGYTHLAWGAAELRFAEQMHELEYGLRASLVDLYRHLKLTGRAAGEELERLLRGESRHGRPPRLAGRLIRILAELELVSLDRDLPAIAVASNRRTELERSPAYLAYTNRYRDGQRFLEASRARLNPRA